MVELDISSDQIVGRLCKYVATVQDAELPKDVVLKAKGHILDTIAAMVSGSTLPPGRLIARYVRGQGGAPEARVVGSSIVTTAVNAALANGMMAHADETDDSHVPSMTHPGCAVIPAAFYLKVVGREKGLGFMRQFAKQDLQYRGGHSQVVRLLAAGKFSLLAVAFGPRVSVTKDRGAPVDWVALEPVFSNPLGMGVYKSAAHPNAAKLYVDFMLSREVQQEV